MSEMRTLQERPVGVATLSVYVAIVNVQSTLINVRAALIIVTSWFC